MNNEEIMLIHPDKSGGIVIMNRKDYISKMLTILSDESKFTKPANEKNLTEQIEQKLTDILRKLKNESFITNETFESLRPSGSNIPRLYGLPKVHKMGTPLRPILDMTNSPYHRTAQWLADLLEPIRKQVSRHSVRDSFEFVNCVENVNVSNQTMISLDVVSLFTNVPLTETICHICELIHSEGVNIGIPTDYLKELLLRCTLNVQFSFNNEIYRQKDGIAMGSPLGPLLADFFMSKLENTCLKNMIDNIELYKRYVDDTFIICNNEDNLEDILKFFNNCHPAIQFTL
uniref:Reverse transcriptase domain-containing protein n=1 Tax=Trichobilharzia regenti TaxID=157069 RepID=A0AA85KG71_TRIRE|nr:unnamed protein product [Trichobilharzia regenti]